MQVAVNVVDTMCMHFRGGSSFAVHRMRISPSQGRLAAEHLLSPKGGI